MEEFSIDAKVPEGGSAQPEDAGSAALAWFVGGGLWMYFLIGDPQSSGKRMLEDDVRYS